MPLCLICNLYATSIKNPRIDLELRVSDLLNVTSKWWDIDKLNDLFYPEDINRILMMKPVVDEEDLWSWSYNKNGDYSVRSGYWLGCQRRRKKCLEEAESLPSLNYLKESIWRIKTWNKIKIFLWKSLSGGLPVVDNMIHK
ncbi:hypothetical protein Bca101_046351 [Brassica carinata]